MINEAYNRWIDRKHSIFQDITRDELLALCVLYYWDGYVDVQNLFYYLMNLLDGEEESDGAYGLICLKANYLSKKYCDSKFSYDKDDEETRKQIKSLSEEYESFYLRRDKDLKEKS